MNRTLQIPLFGALTLLCISGMAHAQMNAAASRSNAAVQGTHHFVHLSSGEELEGRVLALGPDTLHLLVAEAVREVAMRDVLRVDRRGDSLVNGAIVGAAVMAAWCAYICGQGRDSTDNLGLVVAVNIGTGALLGTWIDARHVGRTTIYRRPESSAARMSSVTLYRLRF
ncbi:MAG: hypothetical protein AB7O67_08315 [Vicinamibacterales bacterium]